MAENGKQFEPKRQLPQLDPQLFLQALEQNRKPIVIIDPAGNVVYANPSFCRWSSATREELLGSRLSLLPEDRSAVASRTGWEKVGVQIESLGYSLSQSRWLAMQDGREWTGERQCCSSDDKFCWELVSLSPITDRGGEIGHFLVFVEDITERKRIEADLEQTLAQATQQSVTLEFKNAEIERQRQELDRACSELKATQSQMLQREKMASIGQLAAGVAHEVNNPIGFVSSNLRTLGKYLDRLSGYLGRLEERLAAHAEDWTELQSVRKELKLEYLLEDSRDLIEESLEGSERVRKIVQNLKSFSRIDQAEEEAIDLNACLESTINIVWNEIKYVATLEKEYGQLPKFSCNPQELNQVFMNLLVNAAQAIDKQGTIRIRTWQDGAELLVAISDTGCGIPAENLPRIFEPFFTTKEVGKGTGLGMSISYEIVKKHGGEIQVESRLGRGTTFTVRLPAEA